MTASRSELILNSMANGGDGSSSSMPSQSQEFHELAHQQQQQQLQHSGMADAQHQYQDYHQSPGDVASSIEQHHDPSSSSSSDPPLPTSHLETPKHDDSFTVQSEHHEYHHVQPTQDQDQQLQRQQQQQQQQQPPSGEFHPDTALTGDLDPTTLTPEQQLIWQQMLSLHKSTSTTTTNSDGNFQQKPKRRRKPTKWESWEEQNLIEGVRRFGRGNWATIRSAMEFQSCRTNVDLHDKWRVLTGERRRQRQSDQMQGLVNEAQRLIAAAAGAVASAQPSLSASTSGAQSAEAQPTGDAVAASPGEEGQGATSTGEQTATAENPSEQQPPTPAPSSVQPSAATTAEDTAAASTTTTNEQPSTPEAPNNDDAIKSPTLSNLLSPAESGAGTGTLATPEPTDAQHQPSGEGQPQEPQQQHHPHLLQLDHSSMMAMMMQQQMHHQQQQHEQGEPQKQPAIEASMLVGQQQGDQPQQPQALAHLPQQSHQPMPLPDFNFGNLLSFDGQIAPEISHEFLAQMQALQEVGIQLPSLDELAGSLAVAAAAHQQQQVIQHMASFTPPHTPMQLPAQVMPARPPPKKRVRKKAKVTSPATDGNATPPAIPATSIMDAPQSPAQEVASTGGSSHQLLQLADAKMGEQAPSDQPPSQTDGNAATPENAQQPSPSEHQQDQTPAMQSLDEQQQQQMMQYPRQPLDPMQQFQLTAASFMDDGIAAAMATMAANALKRQQQAMAGTRKRASGGSRKKKKVADAGTPATADAQPSSEVPASSVEPTPVPADMTAELASAMKVSEVAQPTSSVVDTPPVVMEQSIEREKQQQKQQPPTSEGSIQQPSPVSTE